MYLRTKFQVSGICLASFRQKAGVILRQSLASSMELVVTGLIHQVSPKCVNEESSTECRSTTVRSGERESLDKFYLYAFGY